MSYWCIQKKLTLFTLLFCLTPLAIAKANEMESYLAMSLAELGELSVSIATGTAQPIFQSAAITSVVTAQQIKAMGATELHEILETVPGLHVSIQPNTYDYIYTMRGIRNSTNSQVLVLLDGNRFSVPFQGRTVTGLKLPIENIQKIEVIRGPGSALYGADAFAGVINIITKKSKDIGGTSVGGRVGNWNSQSFWGQHGSHWNGWDIATSVQYQHSTGDDNRIISRDSQSVIDSQMDTTASHAPGAMQTQFESWNAHLNLHQKHWDVGFWATNGDSGTHGGAAAALDLQGKVYTQQYLGSVKYSSKDLFDNWEFLAHLNYLYTDFQTNPLQLFPSNSLLPIGENGNIDFTDAANSNTTFFTHGVLDKIGRTQKIPSIELSSIYQGMENHRFRFQAGFRYEELETREYKNIGLGALNGTLPAEIVDNRLTNVTDTEFVYVPNSSRSIWSLAVQDEWQLAKDLQLTTGLRFDHYSDFGATLNPRVSLVWNINEQFTSKLLYGRAFRAPSFSELKNRNNPVLLGNSNLNPEIINTFELAFDYRPFQSLRTAVNLYYYSIKDLIDAGSTVGSENFVGQNNGKQKGFGLEFEWNWQLHEQFSLRGNYAWQHARNNFTNHSVAGVPQQQLYIASLWHFLPKWSIQSQVKWIGKRINEASDKRKELEDYELVDLTLKREKLFGHLNISASVRNVFNKHAREPAIAILSDQIPTQGRSYYLEASVDF